MKNQRGGTFLGFIFGLLAGLAVATVVAVYVARVPLPFFNKNGAWRANNDQVESDKNRDWDPNAALRPRANARPVPSGAVAGAPEPVAIAPPAEAATDPRRPGASTPARGAAGADPLGQFAAARMGAQTATQTTSTPAQAPTQAPAPARPPAQSVAVAEPFAYFVQAGAFRAAEDAEAQRARLLLMGVQARVSSGEQAGRTVYRVRVGPLQNKDAADRVKERLDGNGFEATLVRQPASGGA